MKGFCNTGDPRHQAWINANVSDVPDKVRGTCRRQSEAMVAAFPELRIVGVSSFGMREHCWCATKDNKVADPTAHQFRGPFNYSRFLELEDFPTGKCMNCGELIYPDNPRTRAYFGVDDEEGAEYCGLGPHKACNKILNCEWEDFKKEQKRLKRRRKRSE